MTITTKHKCPKCQATDLFLEPRGKNETVETAAMVALKCTKCKAWIKWCPRGERHHYTPNDNLNDVEKLVKAIGYENFITQLISYDKGLNPTLANVIKAQFMNDKNYGSLFEIQHILEENNID